jgi:hypothetical protein
MSRHRVFGTWEIPRTVVDIVKSICADYDRRAIAMQTAAEEIVNTYKAMNDAIDHAMQDIEPAIRRTMLEDIYTGRGYGYSPASAIMTKNAYYSRKRKAVHDIAVNLMLLEQ